MKHLQSMLSHSPESSDLHEGLVELLKKELLLSKRLLSGRELDYPLCNEVTDTITLIAWKSLPVELDDGL